MNHWSFYNHEVPAYIEGFCGTEAMNRLKDIGMNCGCEYTSFPRFRHLQKYSRFDHSLGAALIVHHFSNDPKQAIAALLHDIATPVFAHVVDFLRGDYLKQEATEEGTRQIIERSTELQDLLHGYGLHTEDVCDYHIYPLADNDPPRLSSDRLEYTLGNIINYKIRSEEEARKLYEDLCVGINEEGGQEIMFQDEEAAEDFALAALNCSKIHVSDEDRWSMEMMAELLKEAIAGKILTEEDLYTTETKVIGTIRSDPYMNDLWNDFVSCDVIIRSDTPTGMKNERRIFAKKRFIDPFVRDRGRLSKLSLTFAKQLNDFIEESQDCWIRGQRSGSR